ncbi:MAG TPA: metallophosphoesterase [Bdellovibrionales bacterium]|nr:metallophosphoesterase [Bdellovibrionales bacterium]
MRRAKFIVAAVIALIAGAAVYFVYKGRGDGPKPQPYHQPAVVDKYRPVAILGNARRTSVTERWLRFKEDNLKPQLQLFDFLKKEGPGLLIFLGDQVNRGSSRGEWKHFDQNLQYFFNNKVPVLSILGEREYGGLNNEALGQLHARFPALKDKTWSSLIYLNLGLIFLNTNFGELGEAADQQRDWFTQTLKQFDGHKAVDGVVVFSHHPPLTNGPAERDPRLTKDLLEPFFEARKTLLFVSGHVGAYEKFHEREKYLVVSGGAGAPRDSLAEGEDRPAEDLFKGAVPRPFHYLLLLSVQGGVTLEVKGFDKGEAQIRQIDKYYIPFR